MISKSDIGEMLPPVVVEHPPSAWIHSQAVGGAFGITAAVSHFAEVLDWQEKRRTLTQGYYRLVHPPRVRNLKLRLEAKYRGYTAVLYASRGMAEKELNEFLAIRRLTASPMVYQGLPEFLNADFAVVGGGEGGLGFGAALLRDAALALELHERNRRRGGSLSARNVAWLLGDPDAPEPMPGAEQECARRLCEWEHAHHALFYPSGMGAVTAVLDHFLTPEHPRLIVLGNVYRDTHLLLEEQVWAGRPVVCDFLDTHDLKGLRARIGSADVAGVFVETITNPLIEIPDLPAIAEICARSGRPLLVDSTMATPFNARPLELGAEVVIHSTSKYLSGTNTHGGGVVLLRDGQQAEALRSQQERWDNRLSPLEFPPLLQGLHSFVERMPRFNRNGERLSEFLRGHPAVRAVWYGNEGRPGWLEGLGGVVSFLLRDDSLAAVARFFDSPLPGVIKAPSLGSDQTLFCPYILLAYYDKSVEYLRDCNLPRHLLRIAAGSEEDFDPVLDAVGAALDAL